ncbi:MAG: sulfurtransferase FdhD [Robiginitomaculum sp.]|nr:MAG: sulfurtransferase FdhD [Robiginitomaculum sp.]
MFTVKYHGDALPTYHKVDVGEHPQWAIPEEVPVAFVFNRRNYAVMMATPDDLVDFALGFSLSEQVVKSIADIVSLDIYQTQQGVDFRFKIIGSSVEKLELTQRRRNMVGSASCGLCGLENAETLFVKLPKTTKVKRKLDMSALSKALVAFPQHQPLNEHTHSVHAAAWVSLFGEIAFAREDVGRHNALDKLLGAMARAEVDVKQGFVLMSSRCSYEIVEKAAHAGVQAILSISGPTAFALRKAREGNIAIYARSGKETAYLIE